MSNPDLVGQPRKSAYYEARFEKWREAVELMLTTDLTYTAIAEKLGITKQTFIAWRKNPEFQALKARYNHAKVDLALYERAVMKQDPSAMKLWYDRYGREPQKDDPLKDMLGLTDSDLEEIALDAHKYVAAKKKVEA